MLNRLLWLSRSHIWISPSQHGFREAKSTETTGHELFAHIEAGFVEKRVSACTFLDIKSAFDSAWHSAIQSALIKRSCPPYLIRTVLSFLANRKAILTVSDAEAIKTTNLGCLQGGVLSPFF